MNDPTTVEELDRWLDANAADIAIAHYTAEGTFRATLAELQQNQRLLAERWRAVFRTRWEETGWLPNLTSKLEEALDQGVPVHYEGPCPWCRQAIRVQITVPRKPCPNCKRLLPPGPSEGRLL